ncbi:Hint domain-containing protein [Nioella ostreopsis]|uniref:Hint domain-containing protein n=1 Tax=Nioella ostreopsis TaxID=2448479 RepID=UPI000FDA4B9B|nr:Hint domain-containing protein [Nioella ostreopsis]
MATWQATHYVDYNQSGNLAGAGTLSAPASRWLLDDGDADTSFEVGDVFTNDLGQYTYLGTVEVDGITAPAFEYDAPGVSIYDGYVTVFLQGPSTAPSTTLSITPESYITCFLAGSLIATLDGERPVETLGVGDRIMSATGVVSVNWIGRQTVSTRFGPAERLMPVRFAAGSLGAGVPHSDLTVTADHGMLVDGVICHAGALVNGTTITRVPLAEMGQKYTVYHIETEEHEIILANGAPAETFIDNVSRRAFDNYAEFETLYGDVPEMEELPYPRAMSARQVPGWIRRALSAGQAA